MGRRLAPLLIDFAGVTEAGRVLDVGCGTGSLTLVIACRLGGGVITGIDLSPGYIARAAKRNKNSRVTFEVGDACALRMPRSITCFHRSFCNSFRMPIEPSAAALPRGDGLGD